MKSLLRSFKSQSSATLNEDEDLLSPLEATNKRWSFSRLGGSTSSRQPGTKLKTTQSVELLPISKRETPVTIRASPAKQAAAKGAAAKSVVGETAQPDDLDTFLDDYAKHVADIAQIQVNRGKA